MELLALETLPPEDADQAFVVASSLLDVMLSMPMESAIGLLNVPEPVAVMLLRREGRLPGRPADPGGGLRVQRRRPV